MLYILTFGNPHVEEDSLALKVADIIKKENHPDLTIIKCTSPEQISDYLEKDFMILDVVEGIKETKLIDNIDQLEASKTVTLHDFDLGFFLKLSKQADNMNEIKIIGIPQEGDIDKIKQDVLKLIPI